MNRTARLNADVALIAGIQEHLGAQSFLIAGSITPAAQVASVLQGRVDAENLVVSTQAAWHAAVKAAEQLLASTAPYVQGIEQTIRVMYAASPALLADFALTPRKTPAPRTAAQKVIAAAKAKATRAARHTMGSVQKAGVTGSLTGPVVVQPDGSTSNGSSSATPAQPATPPAAPATPPAAPAGSGATNGTGSTPVA
jgi:hypothetical protein